MRNPIANQAGSTRYGHAKGERIPFSGEMPPGIPAAIRGSHRCQCPCFSSRVNATAPGGTTSTWSPWVIDTTCGGRPIASR